MKHGKIIFVNMHAHANVHNKTAGEHVVSCTYAYLSSCIVSETIYVGIALVQEVLFADKIF